MDNWQRTGAKDAFWDDWADGRNLMLTLRRDENHDGAQMDLIIDRLDNVVNLCEMKFYSDDVEIDKDEDRKLRHFYSYCYVG